MTTTTPPACWYCNRTGEPLEACCGHHPDTPVCADREGCRDFLIAGLRAAEAREAALGLISAASRAFDVWESGGDVTATGLGEATAGLLDALGGEDETLGHPASGPEAAKLAAITAVIDEVLGSETADRQLALERIEVIATSARAWLPEHGAPVPYDGQEPYCTVCGEWAGMFAGLEGWRHFRGDPAPGGKRTLYDAGHAAVIGWTNPPGRALSPAGMVTLGRALADAARYLTQRLDGGSADAYEALAAVLGIGGAL